MTDASRMAVDADDRRPRRAPVNVHRTISPDRWTPVHVDVDVAAQAKRDREAEHKPFPANPLLSPPYYSLNAPLPIPTKTRAPAPATTAAITSGTFSVSSASTSSPTPSYRAASPPAAAATATAVASISPAHHLYARPRSNHGRSYASSASASHSRSPRSHAPHSFSQSPGPLVFSSFGSAAASSSPLFGSAGQHVGPSFAGTPGGVANSFTGSPFNVGFLTSNDRGRPDDEDVDGDETEEEDMVAGRGAMVGEDLDMDLDDDHDHEPLAESQDTIGRSRAPEAASAAASTSSDHASSPCRHKPPLDPAAGTVASPGWAAKTLGKLSLASPDMRTSGFGFATRGAPELDDPDETEEEDNGGMMIGDEPLVSDAGPRGLGLSGARAGLEEEDDNDNDDRQSSASCSWSPQLEPLSEPSSFGNGPAGGSARLRGYTSFAAPIAVGVPRPSSFHHHHHHHHPRLHRGPASSAGSASASGSTTGPLRPRRLSSSGGSPPSFPYPAPTYSSYSYRSHVGPNVYPRSYSSPFSTLSHGYDPLYHQAPGGAMVIPPGTSYSPYSPYSYEYASSPGSAHDGPSRGAGSAKAIANDGGGGDVAGADGGGRTSTARHRHSRSAGQPSFLSQRPPFSSSYGSGGGGDALAGHSHPQHERAYPHDYSSSDSDSGSPGAEDGRAQMEDAARRRRSSLSVGDAAKGMGTGAGTASSELDAAAAIAGFALLPRVGLGAGADGPRGEGNREDEDKAQFRLPLDETAEVNAIRDRLGGAANCSAFISKLWFLMLNPSLYARFVHWNENGDALVMHHGDAATRFASEILPKLFKHANVASFVRQLNLYGFQRVPSARGGGVDASTVSTSPPNTSSAAAMGGAYSTFAHPRFRRGREALIATMKPRSSKRTKRASASGRAADDEGEGKVNVNGPYSPNGKSNSKGNGSAIAAVLVPSAPTRPAHAYSHPHASAPAGGATESPLP